MNRLAKGTVHDEGGLKADSPRIRKFIVIGPSIAHKEQYIINTFHWGHGDAFTTVAPGKILRKTEIESARKKKANWEKFLINSNISLSFAFSSRAVCRYQRDRKGIHTEKFIKPAFSVALVPDCEVRNAFSALECASSNHVGT